MEIIDIYDDNMAIIGKKDRLHVHRDGDWHRAFHCWIIYRDPNGDDYIVVQKRGHSKDLHTNFLDITAAGHYLSGETVAEGIREIKEELGIEVRFEELVFVGTRIETEKIGDQINREFDDVFFLIRNQDISEYEFQRDEIAGLAAFKIDDALKMYSGKRKSISGRIITYEILDGVLKKVEKVVNIRPDDFIPRIDSYNYKILILAKRLLSGEEHIAI